MFTLFGSIFCGLLLILFRVGGGWCCQEEKITRELWRRVRPVLESLLVSMGAVFCVVSFGLIHLYGHIMVPYFEYMALHGSLIVGVVAYKIAMPIMTRKAIRDIKLPRRLEDAIEMQVAWLAEADQLTMKYRALRKKPKE